MKRRMPAEWEPHEATWIAWPHLEEDWPGKLSTIDWVYTEIVRGLSGSERIEIVCHDEHVRARAALCLEMSRCRPENFRFHIFPNNRSWLRDSAPTAVIRKDGTVEWIAWRFNAWAKYDNYQLDAKLPAYVSEMSGLPLTPAIRPDNGEPLVLEGGAIETDGQGTLLVTEECLLSEVQQRNAGLSKEQYEQAFAEYLGIRKTIWLGRGCQGDDTHGHIDDIARFSAPGRVLIAVPDDQNDPNYEALQENYQRLTAAKDADGQRLEVTKLPMPREIWYGDEVLPASYANFYVANQCVLVPTFNDPADSKALAIIASHFPGRSVIGIHSVDLVLGQGTMHCLSQQQPAAVPFVAKE